MPSTTALFRFRTSALHVLVQASGRCRDVTRPPPSAPDPAPRTAPPRPPRRGSPARALERRDGHTPPGRCPSRRCCAPSSSEPPRPIRSAGAPAATSASTARSARRSSPVVPTRLREVPPGAHPDGASARRRPAAPGGSLRRSAPNGPGTQAGASGGTRSPRSVESLIRAPSLPHVAQAGQRVPGIHQPTTRPRSRVHRAVSR